jgi:hypothetical protein
MEQKLPAQVQEMSDKADALIASQNTEKPEEKKTEEKPKEDVKAVSSTNEPENQNQEGGPVKTDTAKEENWEHKYKVLQGKYNAEVKVLQDDVKLLSSLKAQVRALNQRIQQGDITVQELKDKLKQKEVSQASDKVEMPEDVLSLLTDDERSHFEEEGIDNKSIQIIGKLIKDLSSRNQAPSVDLEEIKQSAQEIKANRVMTFWNNLRESVPGWETINQSEGFNDWLDYVIPYTSITRRSALQAAQDQLDHSNVIAMFDDFKKSQNSTTPEPKEDPLLDPEKLIEPKSTVGAGEADPEPDKKTYTRDEVKRFYNDLALGKIPQEEADKIDRDIQKANKEGRITN